jgi:hypothetical protein
MIAEHWVRFLTRINGLHKPLKRTLKAATADLCNRNLGEFASYNERQLWAFTIQRQPFRRFAGQETACLL